MCFPNVQQQLKRVRLKRKEMHEQINRGKLLQMEESLEESSLQEDLQKLETTLSKMNQSTESQEKNLEVRIFILNLYILYYNIASTLFYSWVPHIHTMLVIIVIINT